VTDLKQLVASLGTHYRSAHEAKDTNLTRRYGALFVAAGYNKAMLRKATECKVPNYEFTAMRTLHKLLSRGLPPDIMDDHVQTAAMKNFDAVEDDFADIIEFVMRSSQRMASGETKFYVVEDDETISIGRMMRKENMSALYRRWSSLRKDGGKQSVRYETFVEVVRTVAPRILKSMAALDPIIQHHGTENFEEMRAAHDDVLNIRSQVHDDGTPQSGVTTVLFGKVEEFMKDPIKGFRSHFGKDSKHASHCASCAFDATIDGVTCTGEHSDECADCSMMSELHEGILADLQVTSLAIQSNVAMSAEVKVRRWGARAIPSESGSFFTLSRMLVL
jgi:hypothetical protein